MPPADERQGAVEGVRRPARLVGGPFAAIDQVEPGLDVVEGIRFVPRAQRGLKSTRIREERLQIDASVQALA